MHEKDMELVFRQAKEKWDAIAKPIDSLGILEDMVAKLCAISGTSLPGDFKKRALLTFCADHGVVAEGVTQTDSSVTNIVAQNIANGCSGVNYMASLAGVDVFAIDIGMFGTNSADAMLTPGVLVNRKVQEGTANLAKEPAMSMETCLRAIQTGEQLVGELKNMGYEIVAIGEMGIGNTTPTSALLAAMLGLPAESVTGRGAGLDNSGLKRKIKVIEAALRRVQEKEITDAISLLAELGGLEIAGMTGACFGAKKHKLPLVLDGAIASVAALVACRKEADVSDYLLASHVSEEVSGKLALEALQLPAVIHGGLCLGEGSGAMTLFPLLDMAMAVYKNMGSFSDFSIEAYKREGKPL